MKLREVDNRTPKDMHEYHEAKIEALQREVERQKAIFSAFARDVADDMQCLPECDSHGHREGCAFAFPDVAFRRLRARIAELEAENAALRKAVAG